MSVRLAALASTALFVLSGCPAPSGPDGGGGDGGGGGPTSGWVSGTVYADSNGSNGAPVAKVSVTVDGVEVAKANEQGWFYAKEVRAGAAVPLCFVATDFVKRCRTVALRGGQALLLSDTRLMAMSPPATRSGNDFTDSATNAQITLPAAAACVAGAAASNVTCRLTPIDASSAEQRALAPGNYTGATSAGASVALETGGMLDITCTDGAGRKVDVCSGQSVPVRIPIASGCAAMPATMATWSFGENTGAWKQEGADLVKSCTGDTGAYAGTVSHFSYWNADQQLNTTCVKGRVVNAGKPVDGALVRCDGTNYGGASEAYTGADGTFCVAVKTGGAYSCVAAKGEFVSGVQTGTAPAAAAACGETSCASFASDFVVTDPLMRTVLTWGSLPDDLDSHTVGPGTTHVYYTDKGALTMGPFIALDTDDTSSFGPEITTWVPGVADGKYRFCVFNYSGESQGGIADAGASVSVFYGPLVKQYQAPASNPNGYPIWRVYEASVSAGTVTITDLNDYVSDSTGVQEGCRAGL